MLYPEDVHIMQLKNVGTYLLSQWNIPEDLNLHWHHRENLKSDNEISLSFSLEVLMKKI
jgi:HD-like signal output (HDOD) protein